MDPLVCINSESLNLIQLINSFNPNGRSQSTETVICYLPLNVLKAFTLGVCSLLVSVNAAGEHVLVVRAALRR